MRFATVALGIALLAMGSLLLTAVARAEDDDADKDLARLGAVLGNAKVKLEVAVTTAEKEAKGVALASDLEVEKGVVLYEILVYVGGDDPHLVEVEVDATTGKVVETEVRGRAKDDDDDEGEEEEGDDDDEGEEEDDDGEDEAPTKEQLAQLARLVSAAKVKLAQAAKTSEDKAEGRAYKSRLELDNGIPVFEVFVFVAGGRPRVVDVDIDAQTGKVVEMETVKGSRAESEGEEDDDDEGDDEDDDDEE